jgi:hypothetical protein
MRIGVQMLRLYFLPTVENALPANTRVAPTW